MCHLYLPSANTSASVATDNVRIREKAESTSLRFVRFECYEIFGSIGSLELVFNMNIHTLLVINVLAHKIGFMKACRQYYSLEFGIQSVNFLTLQKHSNFTIINHEFSDGGRWKNSGVQRQ